jgi:DNA-binding NarL/FixJ family response regulator
MYDNDQYVLAARRTGAAGYLLKQTADEEVVNACRHALRSSDFLAPAPSSTDGSPHTQLQAEPHVESDQRSQLTHRELQVLKLVADGRSSREIGEQLAISIKTVERHRSNIMDKTKSETACN